MADTTQPRAPAEAALFSGRTLRSALLAALLAVGFGIRIYRVTEPPLETLADRQCRSAAMARAWYFEGNPAIPEWRRDAAQAANASVGSNPPPSIEWFAFLGYRLTGAENLWIPRLISIVLWMISAWFLYLLVTGLADADAALLSAAFYLFMPYGVASSRAFMPDPVMVSLLTVGLFLIFRYFQSASASRLLLAAGVSALGVFVKLVCVFPLACAFMALGLRKKDAPPGRTLARIASFLTLVLAPAAVYFLAVMAAGRGGRIAVQTQDVIVPRLLIHPYFWAGWLVMMAQVVGLPVLVGAALGVFLFPRGIHRAFVVGTWAGYVLFCLLMSYPAYTHAYYHMLLLPIAALSIGPAAAALLRRVAGALRAPKTRAAVSCGILLATVVLSLFWHVYQRRKAALDMLPATELKSQSFLYVVNPDFSEFIRRAGDIGSAVGHTTRAVILPHFIGPTVYRYFGEFSADQWPPYTRLRANPQHGIREIDAEARFKRDFVPKSPEFFIITDRIQLDAQPDLRAFLDREFRVLVEKDGYVIYDLRK